MHGSCKCGPEVPAIHGWVGGFSPMEGGNGLILLMVWMGSTYVFASCLCPSLIVKSSCRLTMKWHLKIKFGLLGPKNGGAKALSLPNYSWMTRKLYTFVSLTWRAITKSHQRCMKSAERVNIRWTFYSMRSRLWIDGLVEKISSINDTNVGVPLTIVHV